MRDKKGVVFGLGILITLGVIAFIIGGLFLFWNTFRYIILGAGLVALSIFVITRKDLNQKFKSITFIVLLVAGGILIFGAGNFLQETVGFEGDYKVTTLVPITASITCERIDTSTSTNKLYSSGIWLSEGYVGINSKTLRNIKITSDYKAQAGSPKVIYKKCDRNKQNCEAEREIPLTPTNQYSAELDDLDLTKNSYRIQISRSPFTLFGGDVDLEGQIQVTFDKFGLVLNSPTFGKRTVCSSSCDLSCPSQSVRNGIVSTTKTSLNFFESTNYIEYWNEVSRASEQLGGTVYSKSRGEYCFGGHIYDSGKIETETGLKYIYPESYDRKEECCPGATVQITNGAKVCNNNYKFETIMEDREPSCTSDLQCPNGGLYGGFQEGSDLFKSKWTCQSGTCKETKRSTECVPPAIGCASDQICEDFKCVGGLPTPQIVPDPVEDVTDKPLECSFYEKAITVVEKECGGACWSLRIVTVGIVDISKENAVERCVTANWVWITSAVILIGGLGAYGLYLNFNKPKKRKRR